MTTMRRTIILSAVLVALVGCKKEITRENPEADTHVDLKPGLWEAKSAANQMKERIAGMRFPDDAVQKYGTPMPVAFIHIRNDTGQHIDTKILEDEVRDVLNQTGKIAFQIEGDDASAMNQQDEFEKTNNNSDGGPSGGEGQGQKTRYAMTGRLKSIEKTNTDQGVSENTYVFTLKLLDRWKRLEVFVCNSESRLRKQ